MLRFSKVKKKKLQEAAVNKFFASWLRGWCDGIVRGLVPKKPKHRRLRGDWSLKKPKQYGGLKWESFISRRYAMFFTASWDFSGIRQGFSTDTWPTNYRHAANSRPTVGRQTANSRPTAGRKGGKRQSADSWPTVGRLSVDCRPTVGQLLADCWPTVGRQFFGGAVLHFFPNLNNSYYWLIYSFPNINGGVTHEWQIVDYSFVLAFSESFQFSVC